MERSILVSVKNFLGIAEEYDVFDQQITMHINSAFTILHQLGVGPDELFSINDTYEETWDDFFEGNKDLSLARTYVYYRVKLMFDPPQSGTLHQAMERQIAEFEWRLCAAASYKGKDDSSEEESGT